MKSVKDEGLITQLAVVATMMPKVKEYIDQQADRIAELEKDLHMIERHYDQLNTQTKPLSDEEIAKEWSKFYPDVFHTHLIDFVRAIEERHGIK